ncbi:hypothetical protein HK100_011363 [Physocladia obscura]|uniref:PH domain-containing protein n=1 Tax=Physocladia obscura TaxID=109957 RepID=A0AAD5XD98_9FUNG|nr:hypothetical protein HK100_011363 [Physocladia obscura]
MSQHSLAAQRVSLGTTMSVRSSGEHPRRANGVNSDDRVFLIENDETNDNESDSINSSLYYGSSLDDSFAVLQRTLPLMSGSLLKLNTSATAISSNPSATSTSSEAWNARFFVLARDGKLFIFKRNPNPNSLPLTYLPVSGYSATNISTNFILNVAGDGITPDGVVTKRVWTLKTLDPQTNQLWIDALTKIVGRLSLDLDSIGSQSSITSPVASGSGEGALRFMMHSATIRHASAAQPPIPGITPTVHRSRSHGARLNTFSAGRDLRDAVVETGKLNVNGLTPPPPPPRSNSQGSTELPNQVRLKQHFAMPTGAAEEGKDEILYQQELEAHEEAVYARRQRRHAARSAAREAAIAERIAAAKMERLAEQNPISLISSTLGLKF